MLAAIALVASFTFYKWTTLLHRYGNYGSYVAQSGENDLGRRFILPYLKDDASSFEKETIYREAVKYQYDVAFSKIWTFGAFVFASAFLLLMVIPNKKE